MNRRSRFLPRLPMVGLFALGGLVAVVACVSDPGAPPAGIDPGTTDAGADSGPTDTLDSGDAVDAGESPDAAALANCETYCDDVLANCTGDFRAFSDHEQCMKMCALIPPGKPGDKNVNTVQCRLPFAAVPGSRDTCLAASAYGGGACGDVCPTFCSLVDKHCIQGPPVGEPPYASGSDCIEACQKFAFDPKGPEGPGQPADGPDTLNCRMYHLILSLADRKNHCPHVAIQSATCRGPSADGGVPHVVDAGHS